MTSVRTVNAAAGDLPEQTDNSPVNVAVPGEFPPICFSKQDAALRKRQHRSFSNIAKVTTFDYVQEELEQVQKKNAHIEKLVDGLLEDKALLVAETIPNLKKQVDGLREDNARLHEANERKMEEVDSFMSEMRAQKSNP
jgi:hypothetical protein